MSGVWQRSLEQIGEMQTRSPIVHPTPDDVTRDLAEALKGLVSCVKHDDVGDGYAEATIYSEDVALARTALASYESKYGSKA